jgi:hypothetical protein
MTHFLERDLHERNHLWIILLLALKTQQVVIGATRRSWKLTTHSGTRVINRAASRSVLMNWQVSSNRTSFFLRSTRSLPHTFVYCAVATSSVTRSVLPAVRMSRGLPVRGHITEQQ